MDKDGITVLLVEDDQVDRMACRRALLHREGRQFTIHEADTGTVGLKMAHDLKPDCILLDHHLPDMDGLEFLAALEDAQGGVSLPVMMLTGADKAMVAVEALKRGARDYLVKDVERQYLHLLPAVIDRVLQEQQFRRQKMEAEFQLCRTEAKFRTLVEQIPAITYIATLDTPGQLLYVSPQIEVIGFSPEEWLQEPDIHFKQIHPEDRPRVLEELTNSRATGRRFDCEYRLICRNGAILWFRDEATVVWEGGQPLFLQGILIDITASKHLEEELRQHRYRLEELVAKRTSALTRANDQLRQDISTRQEMEAALHRGKERAQVTLEAIADAVITTDARGIVDYMNPVAEMLTSWTASEAKGRLLDEVFPLAGEESKQPIESPVIRCLREAKVVGIGNHTMLKRRDGRDISVSDSAAPIRDRAGNIVGAVLAFRDATQERRVATELSYQAKHDSLTGLILTGPNSSSAWNAYYLAHGRIGENMRCVIWTWTKFKQVNDTCGHAAGDELLRQLSATLQEHVRQRDTLGRLGGDEFGLLLEHCPLDHARRIAEEMRLAVERFEFAWEGKSQRVGVSIGIVPLDAAMVNSQTALMAADSACYAAKQAGRNRIFAQATNHAEKSRQQSDLQWAATISDALNNSGIHLFSQPIAPVGHERKKPAHHEILARLLDAQGQPVAAAVFMPAAERHGLMPALDRFIVERTISHIASTPGLRNNTWFVNLSAATVADETLPDFIHALLESHGIPSPSLGFEINETTAMANLGRATRFLREVRALGCASSLDNYGSGLGTLASLRVLPLDLLKIGGAFIQHVATDPTARIWVRAINEVGHGLGLKTTAECVESETVYEALREIGVDYVQGSAIGAPRPLGASVSGSRSSGSVAG